MKIPFAFSGLLFVVAGLLFCAAALVGRRALLLVPALLCLGAGGCCFCFPTGRKSRRARGKYAQGRAEGKSDPFGRPPILRPAFSHQFY